MDALDRFGLSDVRLYCPDLHSPMDTVEWGHVLMKDPQLRDRFAAVTFHTWWMDGFPGFNAIHKFARKMKKPVWATETGFCASADGCLDKTHFFLPNTWGTAFDEAQSYYRAIAWSHASRVYHWALLGNDAVVSKTGEKYPTYYVLKHFANYIQPNSVLIDSVTNDDSLLSLVFEIQPRQYSAIIINIGTTDKVINLAAYSHHTFEVTEAKTSISNQMMSDTALGVDNTNEVNIQIPAQSVTSLKFEDRSSN